MIIKGSTINVPIRQRWLRSIAAANILLARGKINRDKYWPLYRHCVMKFRSSIEYYRLQTLVYHRDEGCQRCHGPSRKLEMHHIKQILLWPELALDPENVVMLCLKCHKKATNVEHSTDIHLRILRKYGSRSSTVLATRTDLAPHRTADRPQFFADRAAIRREDAIDD